MRKQNWETAPRLTSHDEQLIGMRRFRNIIEVEASIDKWVDLGLPSGLLWASTNIGAEKPEDFGLYFAWGETQGYEGVTIDKQFTWSDYKFGTENALTKYNKVDGLTVLELEDDAAYQSDNTCRIPTEADFAELIANTTATQETLNGINGKRLTSNINGSSIFIPAAGHCSFGSIDYVNSGGFLQTSSLSKDYPDNCRHFNFFSGSVGMNTGLRIGGLSVRAVKSIN